MTSYLGPDNPPPLSLISENYQRCLHVSKVSNDDDSLYSFGEEYYAKMIKLLRLQAGININDAICIVASRKSKLPTELENRLCLLFPVLHLTAGLILYEDSPGKERELNVSVVPINAESYLSNEVNRNKFDKIIIADGLELIGDRLRFLENARAALIDKSDNALIIFHKTKEILTLPVFWEVINNFGEHEIEIKILLEQLLELNLLVGWNIVALPIQVKKLNWFNQLYNFHPPIMEVVPPTDIYSGLRELVDTSFKYSDFLVTLNDRFLLIVASIDDFNSGHPPYRMHLFDEDFSTSIPTIPQETRTDLLRLNITSEIQDMIQKNVKPMDHYRDIESKYPEEWWGTIPSANMGQLDKTRINHTINLKN